MSKTVTISSTMMFHLIVGVILLAVILLVSEVSANYTAHMMQLCKTIINHVGVKVLAGINAELNYPLTAVIPLKRSRTSISC